MQLKHGLLALAMLFTGALNTILLKAQDKQCILNCEPISNSTGVPAELTNGFQSPASFVHARADGDEEGACPPKKEYWEQPVIQALFMFVGESLCLAAYHLIEKINRMREASKENERKPLLTEDKERINEEKGLKEKEDDRIPLTWKTRFLFFIPTLCDLAATSIMNYGLILVAASVYQMLRGAVVLFTAAFSIIFLRRRLNANNWIGLVLVVGGVVVVGLSSILFSDSPQSDNPDCDESQGNPILGVVLVIAAQMFTACQFVFEEKVLHKYFAPPLEAVGYEGIFGLISIAILAPILYFSAGTIAIFDLKEGFEDFAKYPMIYGPGIGSIFTIAFFNFFGLAITRAVSATARSTIDTTRTVLIWVISLAIGWEKFIWQQIIGFILLVLGTFTYNEIIKVSSLFQRKPRHAQIVEETTD